MSCGKDSNAGGLEARQGMYKMRSPAWKETYRTRCLQRLRDNRNKCHAQRRRIYDQSFDLAAEEEDPILIDGRGDRVRNQGHLQNTVSILSIDEIMEQEWNHVSEKFQPHVYSESAAADGASYIDSMVSLYEEVCSELKREIHTDLQREEEQLLRMQEICEAELQYEEDELCSAVESLTTDEVICPLCEKTSLIEHKGVILCNCGLRIDTEQDCINLRNIKGNLQAGASEHSDLCEAKPEFSLSQKFGITNILMSCQECDFLFVIV